MGPQWLDELSWVLGHSLPVQWIDVEAWDCLGAHPLGWRMFLVDEGRTGGCMRETFLAWFLQEGKVGLCPQGCLGL